MEFRTVGFPPILQDNEQTYLRYLEGIISSVDGHASVQITNATSYIHVRISPSSSAAINTMIQALNDAHNNLGIRLLYSKSIKSGSTINFSLELL